jgi:hypothetical protein
LDEANEGQNREGRGPRENLLLIVLLLNLG